MDHTATIAVSKDLKSPSDRIRLEPEWKEILKSEFEKPYMKNLRAFLASELKKKKVIYPPPKDIFNALNLTPPSQVKVVILGQDPYHGQGQAHGLCFSVREGVKPPPSLENIFKELKADVGIEKPKHGTLTRWAEEGVLLINTVLTVEHGKAGSHHGKGWENFTDKIIEKLSEQTRPLVFILWGSPAQKKQALINGKKHLIIKSPHPSPLSAHRGFFGSKPFSQVNSFLKKTSQEPIDWHL